MTCEAEILNILETALQGWQRILVILQNTVRSKPAQCLLSDNFNTILFQ